MGKIENEARIIHRRTNIQKIILRTVATAGIMSIALLAPNALQLLAVSDKGNGKKRRMNPTYLIDSAFKKLCTRGLIRIETGDHGKVARLTDEGKRALALMVAKPTTVFMSSMKWVYSRSASEALRRRRVVYRSRRRPALLRENPPRSSCQA